MSFKRLIAQLVADQEWDTAIKIASKHQETPDIVKTLSLVYRYKNYFDQEKNMLQNTMIKSPYIEERQNFFKRPIFDQLEARQKLCLPKDFSKVPLQSTLEQLCFVTAGGSDQPYFNLLWQLIESLKNTATYNKIPIMIFDCGLTDEDKDKLQKTFNPVTIVDPGWDVDANIQATRVTQDGLKGCTARPFMDKHFPGYRYYMWLDTDTWVQDERALDRIAKEAEENGIGVVQDHCFDTWINSYWGMNNLRKSIIPESFSQSLNDKKTATAGTFCIDRNSGFFLEWQKNFKTAIIECQFTWGCEEVTFIYTANKMIKSLNPLNRVHQFSGCSNGLPIIHNDSQLLYMPDTNQIIGIFHLIGFFALKIDPFIPVTLLPPDQFIPNQLLAKNKQIFEQWLANHQNHGNIQPLNVFPNTQIASFHFRTWPWKDKSEILQQLLQEAQEVLVSES